MKCVVLQPSYIPWRGYFHQIHKADVFVFYDDVQYDKRGWRNRNRVKTPWGSQWLTIPVYAKGCQLHHTPIHQIRICWDRDWITQHWNALKLAYCKAPFFRAYGPLLEGFYRSRPTLLADLTIEMTKALAYELGINRTQFMRSSSLHPSSNPSGSKTDHLVAILKTLGATHYITGPSAKDYLEEDKLAEAGISLEYMVYDYPEYEQLYPPFDPYVSILDLLFMKGPEASRYIWSDDTALLPAEPLPALSGRGHL